MAGNCGSAAGVPAESLSPELAGVWSGWSGLGDREIVREASAKGTHIELAYRFLEQRRHCSPAEAKAYFANEVDVWVGSLLKKKQVHRASHILNNVGKVPADYIRATCVKCQEPELRDYMAQHVESSLSSEEKEAWLIVKLAAEHEQKFDLQNGLISHKCLEEIITLPQSIKDALYTELYFYCYEPKLVAYLKNDVVWDFLLASNKIDLIKLWIDIIYGETENVTFSNDHRSDVQLLFTNLKITNTMIDSIESSNGMSISIDLILNHLCRYGVFTTNECKDVRMILSRIFAGCISISDFEKVLCKPLCNVDKDSFFSKIQVIGLSRNYSEDEESNILDDKIKKLFGSLKEMCNASNNFKHFLETGIVETIKYISRDVDGFLKQNPIIAFTIVFLHYSQCKQNNSETTFIEMFSGNSGLKTETITLPKDVLESVTLQLPFLKNELDPQRNKNNITMYELLDGYNKFNSKVFFKWRLKNEVMPDFRNENLVRKYGYQEELTYLYYLKEARPNMAAYIFRIQQEKLFGGISPKAKSQASLCAHVFALRHLKEIEIVSGCISFLEIIGVSSENLRLHVTAGNLVKKELNISIGKSLELIIYNNQQCLKLVMSYLERAFHSRLNSKILDDTDEFVQVLILWDVIVRFARAHSTTLPTSLLKFLAFHEAWLEFVLVAHFFAYPINQVTDCIQYFENISMREHLLLALSNPSLSLQFSSDNQKTRSEKIKDRDIRQTLHEEIGVKHNSPPRSNLLKLPKEMDPSIKSVNYNIGLNLNANVPFINDLWLIILKCHQSQDPPGALLNASRTFKLPILTVLATCYEPSSISSYCYSWLTISVDNAQFAKDYREFLDSQIWSASTVMKLIHNMVSNAFIVTLNRGIQIFLPENPLKLFFGFLEQCIEYGNFNDSQQYLIDFITECSNYKCNKMINWECNDATYLENVYWIQTVVVKCIIVALGNALRSTQAQIEFLKALIKFEFHKKLIVDTPNLEPLLEYTKILAETPVTLNYFCFDTTENIQDSKTEIEKCVNDLVVLEDYSNALRLSKTANLKSSKIILAQYRSEFKKNADNDGALGSSFWSRCSADFKKYEVCYEKAAEFFVEHAEKVKSYKERYEILKLALEILEENSTDRQTCDKVEMAMWKSCILAGPENIEIEPQNTVFKKLKTELLSSISELQVNCLLTEANEKAAVEILIGCLLDAGRLDTALRISAIFNCRNRELQVLMLCLSLAEGEITPYQLSVQQRSLLCESERPRQRNSTLRTRGLQRLPSSSSLNSSITNTTLNNVSEVTNATTIVEQQEKLDRLSLLTNLIETLNHGVDTGIRILLCYRIAVQLGKSYQVLLTLSNPMRFLQEIVSSPWDRKLEIAKDIITTYQIDNQKIAHFLAEEIVAHITQVIEDDSNEPTAAWNYNMNLQSVIDLCKDSSLLGLKLLDMANKLLGHSYGEKRNLVTLKIIVELLIRSHDCFTASCNMEGIASVLRKCQQLANSLQNLKHWSLLVRLITGVGRFTEMNYIFQILKEHDQFEFLLGRGLDKIPGLRMALLDFLKRNCPEDKDLFNIVALHFRLYYEIALMWENEAKDVINDLVNEAKKECGRTSYNSQAEIKFTRSETIEKRLQLAISNLTHATQYFLQDNKLNFANRCSHQAQLVALQISLHNSTGPGQQFPSILLLSSDEINKAISRHLNFSQALIVARAYDHHVDWASALYSHCLVNGETKYLRDFVTSKRLSPSVVADCARRYKLERNPSKSMQENMRTLVASLEDNEAKYVLASQLGFRSVVEQMLADTATGAYLKDTVFRKRYVASDFVRDG